MDIDDNNTYIDKKLYIMDYLKYNGYDINLVPYISYNNLCKSLYFGMAYRN